MVSKQRFLAHISEDKQREQTVLEHLLETAELSGSFAAAFECMEWGYGCGFMHDIGKYSESFQKRLRGGSLTDHTSAGAQVMEKNKNIIAAYCISGHHCGLLDGGTPGDTAGEATLKGRLKKKVDDYHAFQKEIEIPAFSAIPLQPLEKGGFSLSFFIRMLFSCLVDADFLNTEAFMNSGTTERGKHDSIEVLYDKMKNHISSWLDNTDWNTVDGRRSAILRACLDKGKEEQGLFQLTVPTGGGKTISSLAFALQHAKQHKLERIIYVIPYTSIIEQNAEVFKSILGSKNVLEHHSNVTYEDAEELRLFQLASENWDCPIVVTTNVQFFESLYANKTSQCRKLHNLARSVVIFDEAQMLPVPYLRPCIRAISELVYNYHSTAVICTATQPSLQQFFPEQIRAKEICPDVKGQYDFFKRTNIVYEGVFTEDELIGRLRQKKQVLCILNSRKRVQRVYESLKGDGTYHLSTFMYPIHRKKLLREIRQRLKSGLPCRLIATSLVEAGVDFDFSSVFREMAGIDSVIQAAGRCNREGKRNKNTCRTVVFSLEKSEDIHIPRELELPISVANQIAGKYEDISSLEAIAEYFKRLYLYKGDSLDKKDIVNQFEAGTHSMLFPFASVAKDFRLIENQTKTVLIDVEPEAVEIVKRIRWGEHSRQLLREAGQYCVNIYKQDFEALYGAGLLEQLDEELYVLRMRELYTEDMGLVINVSRGEAVIL